MRITGKLDYLEMPAANGSLDAAKVLRTCVRLVVR